MQEPYRTMWAWANATSFPTGRWLYDVKWTGSAFYVGDDDDHVTVLQDVAGFHHSYNSHRRGHVTREQHRAATIGDISSHIRFNSSTYPTRTKIIRALDYIEHHAPDF